MKPSEIVVVIVFLRDAVPTEEVLEPQPPVDEEFPDEEWERAWKRALEGK